MAIVRVARRLVCVPFVRSFATASGALTQRSSVLVAIVGDGAIGWGEATPWPPFGQGDVKTATAEIDAFAPALLGISVDAARARLARAAMSPAARCAFDLALHDLGARERGMTLAATIGACAERIPVNAVIGADAPDAAAEAAFAAVAAGFTTIKLKVGSACLDDDVARVAAVRAAIGSSILLRLDANGAWSVGTAIAAIERLAPFGIEYVEQPVAAGEVDDLARVRSASAVAIAADESVRDTETARALIDAAAVDVLVLKLTALGGLARAISVAAQARARGIASVVTTTIDFGFATAAALALAATATSARACGLATAALLADDLVGGTSVVEAGTMRVPVGIGCGVEPDEAAIARYAVEPPVAFA